MKVHPNSACLAQSSPFTTPSAVFSACGSARRPCKPPPALRPALEAQRSAKLLSKALTLARSERYDQSCLLFESYLLHRRDSCEAEWVKYAQVKPRHLLLSRAVA